MQRREFRPKPPRLSPGDAGFRGAFLGGDGVYQDEFISSGGAAW